MLDLVIFSWYPANLKTKQGKKCHENFELSSMLQWDEILMDYGVKEYIPQKVLRTKNSVFNVPKAYFYESTDTYKTIFMRKLPLRFRQKWPLFEF